MNTVTKLFTSLCKGPANEASCKPLSTRLPTRTADRSPAGPARITVKPYATSRGPAYHGIGQKANLEPKEPPGLLTNCWGKQNLRQKYPELDQDVTSDVVVVGAGITGVNIAYNLARQGKAVTIVDARTRAAGQTGNTSAHIMEWLDDYYMTVEQTFNTEAMAKVAKSMNAAIDFIEEACEREGITAECKFRRVPGYLIPHDGNSSTLDMLEQEFAACKRAGMNDVEMVDLKGDPKHGKVSKALLFPRSAEFNPLAYVEGMLNAMTKKYGVKVFEFTRVLDAEPSGTESLSFDSLSTNTGHRLIARDAIVYATNSPISRNLGVHVRQEPYRTYMIGFAVPKGSIPYANWWTTEEIYHYVRVQEEKDRDILLVGGEDHLSGQHTNKYRDNWLMLEEFTRARWPVGDVVYRWSGQVYEPADALGLYGLDPLNPINLRSEGVKRYIATGDSGQGMTGSAIAAMVITDQILGKNNIWSDVYSPNRVLPTLKSVEGLASEAAVTTRAYAEAVALRNLTDLKGMVSPASAEADVLPGTGAVLQEGLKKVAVFKDEDGTVHRFSAICNHLGCLVEYNPNDHAFDCPCHGSQFDSRGRCTQGPANADQEIM